jgi:hypothetical protein
MKFHKQLKVGDEERVPASSKGGSVEGTEEGPLCSMDYS